MTEQGNRTVVITGGSRGIGRAVCLAFASPDTSIWFNYSTASGPADETVRLVEAAGGNARSVKVDVSREAEVVDFFKMITEETGRIDVLVNNAGITRDGLFMRMKEKNWDDVLDINLKGAFLCCKAATRTMLKQQYGRIINITSLVGVTGNAGQVNYVASKAGLIGLTKSVARELASRNITANAVAPGFIETDMTSALTDEAREGIINQIPLGRAGTAEDVAGVVRFLASESAAYITGQTLHVSGGMHM